MISCAKTIMGETFGASMPELVTGAVAASYVGALSAGNMLGRLGWAAGSDKLGRRNSYALFGLGIPIALSVPFLTASPSVPSLLAFTGGTWMVVSFYGGLFSVLPAYIADVFGTKHVGAIHGRLLTAWSASALVGPSILTRLRQLSYDRAAADVAAQVDPDAFRAAFGAPVEQLEELLAAKTVTLSKLMEIAPPTVVDPTPTLYNTTMCAMASLMTVALLSNSFIRPVAAEAAADEGHAEVEAKWEEARGTGAK